jgi:hypothetical protein
MQALRQAVEQVLDTKKNGAKLLVRDDSTLLLYDNVFMSQHAVQLILERCPHTEVSTQQCEASRSGYVVQFCLQDTRSVLLSSSFFYLAQCALLCVLAHAGGLLDVFFAP